ncbi:20881_t:CDS:2, partial [Gigaspora margarita]
MKKLNIAIDGLTASGKSTIGKILAEKFGYQFIDTGVFYRYLGYNFHQKTPITKLINTLNDLKNNNKLLQELNTIIELNNQDYLYSGEQASELSKNEKLCKAINMTIFIHVIISTLKRKAEYTTEIPHKKVATINEIEYLLNLNTWQLSQEFEKKAFLIAFPQNDERLKFLEMMLEWRKACVTVAQETKKKMTKNKSNPLFFTLKTWLKNVLKKSKNIARINIQNIEEFIEKNESSSVEEDKEE